MAENEETNVTGDDRLPEQPSTPASEQMEEALDISDPSLDDVVAEQPNDVPEESSADIAALVGRGFTDAEAALIAKGGLTAKVINSMKAPDQKSDAAQDSGERVAEEPDRSEIAALKAQLRALEERVGRSPDATDDLILAEKAASIFGEDRWVQPDSEYARNRMRVKEAVSTLSAGLKAQGKAVPPVAELVRRAVRMEFGDEIAETARAPIAKRQNQFLSRPTARPSRDDVPGEAKARRNLQEKLRQLGAG
jgi:hypothetical protein